jgi:hypothetical protein
MEQASLLVASIHQDNPEDFDGIEPVGLRFQEGCALLYCCTNEGVLIFSMRYDWMIAFEQNLVEAALVIEQAESGLKALGRVVETGMIEALAIDAADTQDAPKIA